MVVDKVVDLPGLVTCGDYTLVVTGTGDNITAARRTAYNVFFDGCIIPLRSIVSTP